MRRRIRAAKDSCGKGCLGFRASIRAGEGCLGFRASIRAGEGARFVRRRLLRCCCLQGVCAIVGGVFTVTGIIDSTIYTGDSLKGALGYWPHTGIIDSTIYTGDSLALAMTMTVEWPVTRRPGHRHGRVACTVPKAHAVPWTFGLSGRFCIALRRYGLTASRCVACRNC